MRLHLNGSKKLHIYVKREAVDLFGYFQQKRCGLTNFDIIDKISIISKWIPHIFQITYIASIYNQKVDTFPEKISLFLKRSHMTLPYFYWFLKCRKRGVFTFWGIKGFIIIYKKTHKKIVIPIISEWRFLLFV